MSVLYRNDVTTKAMGGTELMASRLEAGLNPELLDQIDIVASRVRELNPDRVRIFYSHDLPGDPESEFLKNGGHELFHRLVFVSNWQMQRYIEHYKLPWSKCIVMQNAIDPIPAHTKPDDKIRLIYTPTPHRGLQILVPVFERLYEEYPNLELEVFSSFELYGWTQRDKQYEQLFDACRNHPGIIYHGTKSNAEVREALQRSHIFAYPSIWPETSCICLLEAMSAGLICVHSNFAALPETAANWTSMYQFQENPNDHASLFYTILKGVIENFNSPEVQDILKHQKAYVDAFYNWELRLKQWNALLLSVKDMPRELPKPADNEGMFVYRV